MAVKVYGTNVCPATLEALHIFTSHGYMPVFMNISGSITIMKEYMHMRDTEDCCAPLRGTGLLGLPVFVLDDGTVTRDAKAAFAAAGIDATLSFR